MGFRKALVKRWKRWVGKRKDDIYVCEEEEQTKHEYRRPVDTLSTIAVDDQHDSSILPPKQHSSTCDRSIVLSGLADVPCPDLGIDIDAMLEKFDDSATPAMSHNLEKEQANQANRVPAVTLIPIAKNAQQDSNVPALNRQSSAGGMPIMPSSLADLPFADFDNDALLEEFNDSATPGISHNLEEEQTKEANSLPDGTLSAFIETGRPESSIPVPKQRSYTGMFEKLNAILGTSHKLTASVLGPVFPNLDWVRDAEEQSPEEEQDLLVNDRIKTIYTGCRRVWDLYANRVVPYRVTRYDPPWGISHTWMGERDRIDVWTPINRREWPVPIPKDTNLDLIRIEMLNLGAEDVWLDVLCLRQEHGLREDLRMQEWKIDVSCAYDRMGNFEDDCCWFNRVWTLQEISENMVIGGETGDDGTLEEDIRVMFHAQLASLRKMRDSHLVFDVLSEMKKRVSTKPLDKVAGLEYLLDLNYLPMYDGSQSEEDAWTALVDAIFKCSWQNLLFFYPEPGDGSRCWRRSWKQIMTKTLPSHQMSLWDR
ncbi:uncharacterized protein ARMOST_20436 [Armillaria ostoyae]|uniref:Heterokaryon incompatibility domain-containing protein n=1 Tax=Armillaria ostoyae TaxID=47428 RepID=A0A284S7G7_ARMOS|nr:uncharacterized protein ARMOST_20436 [Armillaria ostoyae]